MRCLVLRRLVLVGLSVLVSTGCADDGSVGDDEPTTASPLDGGSSDGSGSTETGAAPMLDEPYGACVGEQVSSECIDAGPDAAQCLERNDASGLPYSSCAITCFDDGDCPAAGAGNVTPHCWGADDATRPRRLLRAVAAAGLHVHGWRGLPGGRLGRCRLSRLDRLRDGLGVTTERPPSDHRARVPTTPLRARSCQSTLATRAEHI